MNKKFGIKRGINDKAKDRVTKEASEFYFGDRKKATIFNVVHFAGDVKYADAREEASLCTDVRSRGARFLCTLWCAFGAEGATASHQQTVERGRRFGPCLRWFVRLFVPGTTPASSWRRTRTSFRRS